MEKIAGLVESLCPATGKLSSAACPESVNDLFAGCNSSPFSLSTKDHEQALTAE